MFKLISAIFTIGVVVGVALVVRQRRPTGKTEQPAENLDRSNGDGTAEPSEPVTVHAEQLSS